MNRTRYLAIKSKLYQEGYAEEIEWAETVGPPADPWGFFCEYSWVVINSGMKNQVAVIIWGKVKETLMLGAQVSTIFRHSGKSKAIQEVYDNRGKFFQEYLRQPAEKKLNWLETLPWIGPITKFHLAKNLGMDVCKPDRHLVRIAGAEGKTPEELCSALAQATGDRIGVVDQVIWRAANLGWI